MAYQPGQEFQLERVARDSELLNVAASYTRWTNGAHAINFLLPHAIISAHGQVGDKVLFEVNVVRPAPWAPTIALLGQYGCQSILTHRRLTGGLAAEAQERIWLVLPDWCGGIRGFQYSSYTVEKVRFVAPPSKLELAEHLPAVGTAANEPPRAGLTGDNIALSVRPRPITSTLTL